MFRPATALRCLASNRPWLANADRLQQAANRPYRVTALRCVSNANCLQQAANRSDRVWRFTHDQAAHDVLARLDNCIKRAQALEQELAVARQADREFVNVVSLIDSSVRALETAVDKVLTDAERTRVQLDITRLNFRLSDIVKLMGK